MHMCIIIYTRYLFIAMRHPPTPTSQWYPLYLTTSYQAC
jgi:hypothetical protein